MCDELSFETRQRIDGVVVETFELGCGSYFFKVSTNGWHFVGLEDPLKLKIVFILPKVIQIYMSFVHLHSRQFLRMKNDSLVILLVNHIFLKKQILPTKVVQEYWCVEMLSMSVKNEMAHTINHILNVTEKSVIILTQKN
jgi:predicted class III extradiol MEMO1 family dioxygenase